MFVDASALVAVLAKEPGCDHLLARLDDEGEVTTSALAIFETVVALSRKWNVPISAASAETWNFLTEVGVRVVAIGEAEVCEALSVSARYGKGRGHPAQLNMGECFAYACARTQNVPLLYFGEDFARTDVVSALR